MIRFSRALLCAPLLALSTVAFAQQQAVPAGPIVPPAQLKAIPSQYLTYNAFGDSITAGCCTSDPSLIYVARLGAWLKVVPVNHGVSGSQAADQTAAIYAQPVSDVGSQLFTYQIGTNEATFYGTASNRQLTFQALHQAEVAWLATPTRAKFVGQTSSVPVSVSSLTAVPATGGAGLAAIATVTTTAAHGYSSGQGVVLSGADQAAYNITAPITVTSPTTFTYPMSSLPVTPATGTITVRPAAGIVYGGTWAPDATLYGGSMSMKSSTNGSTATWSFYGTVGYLAYGMATGDGGSFTLTVDGTSYGTYTTNGVNGGFATTGVIGTTHGSGLARIAGLTNGYHTVTLTVTSGTGSGNVWVDWISNAGSPSGTQYFSGPTVIVGGAPQQGGGVSTAALYASLARQDAGILANDGLNVIYADGPGHMVAATDINPDNTHPNDMGHLHISEAYEAAATAIANGASKTNGLAVQNSPFTGPILSGASAYGNTVICAGVANNILGGGLGTNNRMNGCGNNNSIAGGNNNLIGMGGTANTNNNFLGAGVQDVIQFGGNNGLVSGSLNSIQGFGGFIGAGTANALSGTNSAIVAGSGATDRGRTSVNCWAGGTFSAQGDAQSCTNVWRASATSTTAVRLTADGAAAGTKNNLNIPINTNQTFRVFLHGRDATAPANSYSWSVSGILTIGATLGTAAVTLGTPDILSTGTTTGLSVAATADTTNGSLNLSFTPPTGNTDTWHVVARVEAVEVQ